MADSEDEELEMALQMSLQSSPPEPKRRELRESPEESVEARNRRLQRELRASAAEKRIRAMENRGIGPLRPVGAKEEAVEKSAALAAGPPVSKAEVEGPLGGKGGGGRAQGFGFWGGAASLGRWPAVSDSIWEWRVGGCAGAMKQSGYQV